MISRSDIDDAVAGYAHSLLQSVKDIPTPGLLPHEYLKVGDIALGTIKQMRFDVTSFVKQTRDVIAALIMEEWTQDWPRRMVERAPRYYAQKLLMLGERFFLTRNEVLLIPNWRWFKPPDYGTAEMAQRLHDVARSFPKVTYHVDQSGRVRQR
jgi:hypothetical protein